MLAVLYTLHIMIRLIITDDHAVFRQGLRVLFEQAGDLEVVAECGNGLEAFELITAHIPDVALLDVTMPELDGISLAARLQKLNCPSRILILTTHEDPVLYERALAAGARGYLLKQCHFNDLLVAVRAVAAGDTLMTGSTDLHSFPCTNLTGREREILLLIAQGLTSRMISEHLAISIKTTDRHRCNIMTKLGLHSMAELVRYAYRTGLA